MIIKSIGHDRQSAIKGPVVNVPIPVSNVVTPLPQAFNELRLLNCTSNEVYNMNVS